MSGIVILLLLSPISVYAKADSSTASGCVDLCTYGNLALPVPGALRKSQECDRTCQVQSCNLGCSTNLSVIDDCNDHCTNRPCYAGCSYAEQSLYNLFSSIRLPPPVILSSGLDSIKIQLLPVNVSAVTSANRKTTNLVLLLQYRVMPNEVAALWETSPKVLPFPLSSPFDITISRVGNDSRFMPNQEYQFRLVLLHHRHVATVSDVVTVRTKANLAATLQAPIINGYLLTNWTYSYCLEAPHPLPRPTSGFLVVLKDQTSKRVIQQRRVQTGLLKHCDVFVELAPGEQYVMVAAMTTDSGTAHKLSEKKIFVPSTTTGFELYVANETVIFKLHNSKDFIVSREPEIIYRETSGSKIIAIAKSRRHLYVATQTKLSQLDDAGSISKVIYDGAATINKTKGQLDIALDELNGRIYIADVDSIVVCSIADTKCHDYIRHNASGNNISLAVDGINGYLYYGIAGAKGIIYQVPAFATGPVQPTVAYSDLFPRKVLPIAVDYTVFGLLFSKDESISAISLANSSITFDIRKARLRNGTRKAYRDVQSLAFGGGRLFWISAQCDASSADPGCLLSEHESISGGTSQSTTIDIQTYLLTPGHGELVDISVDIPVYPELLSQPENVNMLTGRNHMTVTWYPPRRLLFQSKHEWRSIHYKITQYDDGNQIGVVQVEDMVVPPFRHYYDKLREDTNYRVDIQACWNVVCSAISSATGRTSGQDAKDEAKIAISTNDGLLFISEASVQSKKHFRFSKQPQAVVAWMTETNEVDSIAAVGSNFEVADEMSPDGSVINQRATPLQAAVWEPYGERLYWIEGTKIFRSDRTASSVELVTVIPSNTKWISVLPTQGLILYASEYYIGSIYLNGAFNKEFYNSAPSINCSQCSTISAIAVDSVDETAVYLLQWPSKFTLYEIVDLDGTKELGTRHEPFPGLISASAINRKLYILTTEHKLCSTEFDLKNLNCYPYAVNAFSIVKSHPGSTNPFTPAPIEYVGLNTDIIDTIILAWQKIPSFVGSDNDPNTFYNVTLTSRRKLLYQYITRNSSLSFSPYPANQDLRLSVTPFTMWTSVEPLTTMIKTPADPPSIPNHVRLYVSHLRTFDTGGRSKAKLLLEWMPPDWNGTPLGYVVNCAINSIDHNEKTGEQILWRFPPLVPNGTRRLLIGHNMDIKDVNATCRMKAVNKEAKSPSKEIVVTSSLAVESPPRRLIIGSSLGPAMSIKLDMVDVADRDITIMYSIEADYSRDGITFGAPTSLQFVNDTIFGISVDYYKKSHVLWRLSIESFYKENGRPHFNQISHMPQDPRDIKLIDIAADWIGQRLFIAMERPESKPGKTEIHYYDIKQDQVKKLNYINMSVDGIHYDPLQSMLYYTAKVPFVGSTSMLWRNQLDTSLGSPVISGKEQLVECVSNLLPGCSVTGVYKTNTLQTNIVVPGNHSVFFYDSGLKTCREIGSYSNINGLRNSDVKQISADPKYISVLAKNGTVVIYQLADGSVKFINSTIPITAMLMYGNVNQPFPESRCIAPTGPPSKPRVAYRGYDSVTVEFDKASREDWPPKGCMNSSIPAFLFTIQERPTSTNSCEINSQCNKMALYSSKLVMRGLKPEQSYNIRGSWKSIYMDPNASSRWTNWVSFQTNPDLPSKPRSLSANGVSPEQIQLSWYAPRSPNGNLSNLVYGLLKISEQQVNVHGPQVLPYDGTTGIIPEDFDIFCSTGRCFLNVTELEADHKYFFKVFVKHKDAPSSECSQSDTLVSTRTYKIPGVLSEVASEHTTAMLVFTYYVTSRSAAHEMPTKTVFQYQATGSTEWDMIDEENFTSQAAFSSHFHNMERSVDRNRDKRSLKSGLYYILAKGLQPYKQYRWRMYYEYPKATYIYQTNHYITYTKASEPDPPTGIFVDHKTPPSKIKWKPPQSNGGYPVTAYLLQIRDKGGTNWTSIDILNAVPYWVVPHNMSKDEKVVQFRVAALNKLGRSKFSNVSEAKVAFGDDKKEPSTGTTVIVIAVVIGSLLALVIPICAYVLYRMKRDRAKKGTNNVEDKNGADVLTNWTYAASVWGGEEVLEHLQKEELEALPKVHRDDITIKQLLGEGAFGSVFEGFACNIPSIGPKTTQVAVKTLGQRSKVKDRIKFLMEAIRMRDMKHKNVVAFYGVSIGSDGPWLLLEMMEGGDLLNYLRSVRPKGDMPSQVSLKDLMSILCDVAEGLKYLEQIHFVHRDLAARNCLVSSRRPSLRTVKIADFGLARDVYVDDYYRLEGCGYLPIRWMAPEALKDGYFSLTGDVWSFGILMWEVMTLGQKPYKAQSNHEAALFVEAGNVLPKPDFCPLIVYDVMLSCWTYEAERRPASSTVLVTIKSIAEEKELNSDQPFPPVRGTPGIYNRPLAIAPDNYRRDSGQSSHEEPPLAPFTTHTSRRFGRAANHASLKPERRRGKASVFRSLRLKRHRTKPIPPPLPSKAMLEPGRSDRQSGGSDAISITTTRQGYEVPLLKNLDNNARRGKAELNSSPPDPPSRRPKTLARYGIEGATNLAFDPGTPSSIREGSQCELTNFPGDSRVLRLSPENLHSSSIKAPNNPISSSGYNRAISPARSPQPPPIAPKPRIRTQSDVRSDEGLTIPVFPPRTTTIGQSIMLASNPIYEKQLP